MATDAAALDARDQRSAGIAAALAAVPRWALLLACALVARIFTFGNPIVDIDEQFYLLTAQRMLEGGTLYVDLWDRKPVGLFLLYMPAALFSSEVGVWVYQFTALAFVVGTGLVVARIAEQANWGRGATAAGLLYVFMLGFGDGQGGQAPVFYNLLTAMAVALILPRDDDVAGDRRRLGRGVLALGLIGLGLQIKYSLLFEGLFLGLWLMWREHRLGAQLPQVAAYGAAMVAAAVLPTAIAWASFAALGHGDAWLFANFGSILARQRDPLGTLAWNLFKIAMMLGPLLAASALGRRAWDHEPSGRALRGLLFGWLVAALLGMLLFGGYFSHYALPVMLPGALSSAAWWTGSRIGARFMWPTVAVVFLGSTFTTWSARHVRGDGPEFAALTQAIGPGRDCIYVYSGTPMVYGYTGRCAPTAWLFPSHLGREREASALGVDQLAEIDRVFARRPEYVVMRPPYRGERPRARARILQHLRSDYRLKNHYPLGNQTIDLFERQAAPAVVAPARRAASSPS